MADVREEARANESPTALLLRSKSTHKKSMGNCQRNAKVGGKIHSEQRDGQSTLACNHCLKPGYVEANYWVNAKDFCAVAETVHVTSEALSMEWLLILAQQSIWHE
jgi:hypothetical protein